MTEKSRTPEEIVDWLHEAVTKPGRHQRKPDGFNRELIVVAIREALDARDRELREELQRRITLKDGNLDCRDTGDAIDAGYVDACNDLLVWLDARG